MGGFGCVTKHKLPSQLISVAGPTLNEEIEERKCEEDDVMTIITIADIVANARFEEVSLVITEGYE